VAVEKLRFPGEGRVSDTKNPNSPAKAVNVKQANRHHVPPRNPDPHPRFIKRKDERHHKAYHLLFAGAKSYEDACLILWQDWWEQSAEDIPCRNLAPE
jgi:hypothetical protein